MLSLSVFFRFFRTVGDDSGRRYFIYTGKLQPTWKEDKVNDGEGDDRIDQCPPPRFTSRRTQIMSARGLTMLSRPCGPGLPALLPVEARVQPKILYFDS